MGHTLLIWPSELDEVAVDVNSVGTFVGGGEALFSGHLGEEFSEV